jgi:hypothetical protein
MAGNLELEKTVLTLGTRANIMDHLISLTVCRRIAYEPDMRHSAR